MRYDLHELSFNYFLPRLFIVDLVDHIIPFFALDKLLIIIGSYLY